MPLWHANYLDLKIIKAQKTEEEALTFPKAAEKNSDTYFMKRAIPADNYIIMCPRSDRQGGIQHSLLKFLFMSHGFCVAQQTFVSQTFTHFHLSVNCFPAL